MGAFSSHLYSVLFITNTAFCNLERCKQRVAVQLTSCSVLQFAAAVVKTVKSQALLPWEIDLDSWYAPHYTFSPRIMSLLQTTNRRRDWHWKASTSLQLQQSLHQWNWHICSWTKMAHWTAANCSIALTNSFPRKKQRQATRMKYSRRKIILQWRRIQAAPLSCHA